MEVSDEKEEVDNDYAKLWNALRYGDSAALQAVLQHEDRDGETVDLNDDDIRNDSEETPLMMAARMGEMECVQVLLNHLTAKACAVCKQSLSPLTEGTRGTTSLGARKEETCSNATGRNDGESSHSTATPTHNEQRQDVGEATDSRKRTYDVSFGAEETPETTCLSKSSADDTCIDIFSSYLGKKNSEDETALKLAIEEDFDEVALVLIQAGAGIRGCFEDDIPDVLEKAATAGHRDVVLALLETSAVELDHRRTALEGACQEGHVGVARLLLDHGSGLELSGEDAEDALLGAAENGHDDIVQLLLDQNSKCQVKDMTSAVRAACEHDHGDVLRVILDHGVKLSQEEAKDALCAAAENGCYSVVELLLNRGFKSSSAFTTACRYGRAEVAKLLLDHQDSKVDPSQMKDLLFSAAFRGHWRVAKLLLDRGVDPNTRYGCGRNALLVAADSNDLTGTMVEVLLDRGFDPNVKDDLGKTPLLSLGDITGERNFFIQRDILHRMKTLLAAGADVNYRNPSDGASVLTRLSARPNLILVEACIEAGAEVDNVDVAGDTAFTKPLEAGSDAEKLNVTRALVKAGANVHHVNNSGRSPLVDALVRSNYQLVSYLLSLGVNVNQVDRVGQTPLTRLVAKVGTDPPLVQVLLKAGAVQRGSEMQELFYHADCDDVMDVVGALITHGAVPTAVLASRLSFQLPDVDQIQRDASRDHVVTPLSAAAFMGRVKVARYLLAVRFLTPYDLYCLAQDVDEKVQRRGEWAVRKNIRQLMSTLQFPSLFNLCFVTVTNSLLWSGLERADKINQLPIPEMLKNKLKFVR